MLIQTRRFGALEVDEGAILTIRRGLLGFENYHRYVLIQSQEEDVFRWMQCVDDPALAFVVIDPVQWFPDYCVNLADEDALDLGIENPDEAGICAIVTIPPRMEEMTANLLGPIIINVNNGLAAQIILDDTRYHTRHRLLVETPQACTNAA